MGSAFALAAFAALVFAAFIFAFATLAGMLLRSARAARIANDVARLGRADDLPSLAFALTLAALAFAAFTDLVDRRRQRLRGGLCQNRLARLRDHEGADAHPQFRTHTLSLYSPGGCCLGSNC
ncbi:conserved hypothetical protein [Sphingomonas aurantiaca]|uniref:Uncharacterized protein n=1 Tax=Sphingomonas aurantiaca TaxID=185949 RepID=A0A5E7YFL0_9SPHN|nr:conserved hypothetical protein [Sphingomonas aurantiaca]